MELGILSHAPSSSPCMTEQDQSPGVCPFCGSIPPDGSVVITYEVDGEQRVFARCSESKASGRESSRTKCLSHKMKT